MLKDLKGVETRYFIDGRQIVSKAELAKAIGVTGRTLIRYVEMGMPLHELSKPNFNVFDIEACLQWRHENVKKDKSKSAMTRKKQGADEPEPVDETGMDVDEISFYEAERREKVLKVKLAQIKLDVEEGKYILADDVDKSMAELAAIYVSNYHFDKKQLPIDLEHLDKSEIASRLSVHFSKRINDLQKFLESDWEGDESLYEVVQQCSSMLRDGATPELLISRLGE